MPLSWIEVLFHLRGSCPFFPLQQSLLCASHGHCQWMDNLCSICVVPEGLGTEFSAASQQLQAKLFDLSLASRPAALPSFPQLPTQTGGASAEAILNYRQSPSHSIPYRLPTRPGCWRHAGIVSAMKQHRTSPLRGVCRVVQSHPVLEEKSQSSHTGLAVAALFQPRVIKQLTLLGCHPWSLHYRDDWICKQVSSVR